jgi:uncharacterized protein YbjT (DUF2867 family)
VRGTAAPAGYHGGQVRIAVAGGSGTVGQYVVEAGRANGHEMHVLSRSSGVDVLSGEGLAQAIDGANAVIDVTNPVGAQRNSPETFFTGVARQLQAAGARRLVTLSIVGIERSPNNPYYAAKVQQEHIVLNGSIPAAVLRATQFHEFGTQLLRRGGRIPNMRVQSVAARTVGHTLLDVAVSNDVGRRPDLAGPEQMDLVAQVRAFIEHFNLQLQLVVTDADPNVPRGANLPGPEAHIAGPRFEEWLASDDAARGLPSPG